MPDDGPDAAAARTTVVWRPQPTPVGTVLLTATGQGLAGLTLHVDDQPFGPVLRRTGRRLGGVCVRAASGPGAGGHPAAARALDTAIRQLDAYFAGRLHRFSVPLDWSLTSGFQRRVLRLLEAEVPYGRLVSYRDLAESVGAPDAARAVGGAVARNPLSLVVPCHRVVSSGGGLGGFGSGPETKRELLEHEGALPARLL